MLCATFKIVDDDRRYLNRLIELIRGNYKHDFGEEEQKVDFTVSDEAELPLQEIEGESDNEGVIVFFDDEGNDNEDDN